MSEPQITWSGVTPDDIAATLEAHPFAAEREGVMTKITFVLLAKAQPHTPWRHGTLRRSETTRVERGGLRGAVGTNVAYAPFVHARVPFFEFAKTDARSQVDRIMQQAGDQYFKDVI